MVVIMGRLTRDPELRRTGSGLAVTSFSVAVERDYASASGEKEVDYIDCVAWRQTGEFVSKWFTKGSMIVVVGRLQIRSWTDKDGNKRKTAEINVDSVYFGESKKDKDAREAASAGPGYYNYPYPAAPTSTPNPIPNYQPQPSQYTYYSAPTIPATDFAMLDDDDAKLPF
jgi:single-strand DNA-binding protein